MKIVKWNDLDLAVEGYDFYKYPASESSVTYYVHMRWSVNLERGNRVRSCDMEIDEGLYNEFMALLEKYQDEFDYKIIADEVEKFIWSRKEKEVSKAILKSFEEFIIQEAGDEFVEEARRKAAEKIKKMEDHIKNLEENRDYFRWMRDRFLGEKK